MADDTRKQNEYTPKTYQSKGGTRIPQHKHCTSCGKAVPVDENYCSENCKEQMEGVIRKRQFYVRIMYASIAVLLFMMVSGLLN